MSSVRFSGVAGAQTAQSGDFLYRVAKKGFAMSGTVQHKVDEFAARQAEAGIGGKAAAGVVKVLGGFVAQMLDAFDYREIVELPLGKKILKIASQPKGAAVVILLPCTIGARVYQALKRGRKHNDYREIGDILRRDVTAISAFLFLLGPLTNWVVGKRRGKDGLDLINPQTKALLSYSQLKNYRLDTPQALEAIIREGNGQGFGAAMAKLTEYSQDANLKPAIEKIQALSKTLADTPKEDQAVIRKLSGELHQLLLKTEAKRAQAVTELAKRGAKVPSHLKNDILDAVTRYGKARRLPVDAASFLICLGVIGWLPIWFNEQWTKKKFAEEEAKLRAANSANFDRRAAYQALYAQSSLSGRTSFHRGA